MILKIFLPKNQAKVLAVFAQTIVTFCKNSIATLFFENNGKFFAENWRKSMKIVIITSASGWRRSEIVSALEHLGRKVEFGRGIGL
jgi:hypothetical protein